MTVSLNAQDKTSANPETITNSSSAQDKKTGKIKIEWTPIEGVQGYFVQLKSKTSNAIIYEKRVDSSSVDLELTPGEYMQRVGIINKFHKVSSFTDWTELKVILSMEPEIFKVDNGLVRIDEGEKLINIIGEKFQSGAKVMLLGKNGGKTFDITPEFQTETMIQIKVNPEVIPEGRYHVVVENPGGKRAHKENSLALYQNKPPSLEDKPSTSGDKALAENKAPEGFQWTNFILGYPRFKKKDYFIASGQVLAFTGSVAGAAIESNAASNVAKATAGDFQYQMFNNYLIYTYFVRPNITNSNLLFNLGLKSYLDTDLAKQKYIWHSKNALNFAGAAALIYLIHVADAFGWIDISFGLANSSTAYTGNEIWNAGLLSANNFGESSSTSWELKFSIPMDAIQ